MVEKQDNKKLIIGIVIGIVAVCAVIAGILCWKKKKEA